MCRSRVGRSASEQSGMRSVSLATEVPQKITCSHRQDLSLIAGRGTRDIERGLLLAISARLPALRALCRTARFSRLPLAPRSPARHAFGGDNRGAGMRIRRWLVGAVCLATTAGTVAVTGSTAHGTAGSSAGGAPYIVVLKNNADPDQNVKQHGAKAMHTYRYA